MKTKKIDIVVKRRGPFHWLAHEKANLVRLFVEEKIPLLDLAIANRVPEDRILVWVVKYYNGALDGLKRWNSTQSLHRRVLREFEEMKKRAADIKMNLGQESSGPETRKLKLH